MSTYRELRSEVIDIRFNELNFWKYIDVRFGYIVDSLNEYLEVDPEATTSEGEKLVQVFELSRNPLGIEFSVSISFDVEGDIRHIAGKYLFVVLGDELVVQDFERKFSVTLKKRESGLQFWKPAFVEICGDMLSRLKSISPKI